MFIDIKGIQSATAVPSSMREKRSFVGRDNDLRQIAEFLDDDEQAGRTILVYGPSGIGKSSLTAEAVARAQRSDPEIVIAARFIGAAPESVALCLLLEDVKDEIRARCGLPASAHCGGLAEVVNELSLTLAEAGRSKRVIVVSDALDQLSASSAAERFNWIPPDLPPGVRLILTIAGEDADRLQELCSRVPSARLQQLRGMSTDDARELLTAWLTEDNRNLRDDQQNALLDAFAHTGSPLHLRMLYEDSQNRLSYDDLPASIPATVHRVIQLVTEKHGSGLVRRIIAALCAARNGLTEDELMEVVWDPEYKAEFQKQYPDLPGCTRLPFVVWSRLRIDLSPYLTKRQADGTVTSAFFHRAFAEAAARSLGFAEHDREAHQRTARYFAGQKTVLHQQGTRVYNARKLSELLYQQLHGRLGEDLHRTLSDFTFLDAAVRERGIHALLDDLSAIVHVGRDALGWSDDQWRGFQGLIHALELSSHALVADRAQLASQLAGRLKERSEPMLKSLLKDAERNPYTWLKPQNSELVQAGAPMLRSIGIHKHCVQALGIIGDGEQIATGSRSVTRENDFALKLWRASSGMEVRPFRGLLKDVTSLAPSPDGTHLATGSSDGCVLVWSLAQGSAVGDTAERHQSAVSSVVFTGDGKHIFSAAWDGTIRVWDARGRYVRELCRQGKEGVNALAMVRDTLVSASYAGWIALWDVKGVIDGSREDPLCYFHGPNGHRKSVDCLTSNDSAELVASASNDGYVKVWQLADCTLVADWRLAPGFRPTAIGAVISGTKEYLLVGDDHGFLWIWDFIEQRSLGARRVHTFDVTAIRALSADMLVTTSKDTSVKIWNTQALLRPSGFTPRAERPLGNPSAGCAYLPARERQRRAVLSCSAEAHNNQPDSVTISNRRGGGMQERRVTDNRVTAVAATADGQWLYTSDAAREGKSKGPFGITKWSLKALLESAAPQGKLLVAAHDREVNSLAISGDGKRLLSIGDDWTAVLWDTDTDEPIARFTAEGSLVACSLDAEGNTAVITDEAGRNHVLKLMPAYEVGQENS